MNYSENVAAEPTVVESLSTKLRNLTLAGGFLFEVLGSDTADGEMMKRGVGLLAIAGICEILRHAEAAARAGGLKNQENY